jgi:predicted O-linked N-acetylglucosamine transferase (SPINDLY family)
MSHLQPAQLLAAGQQYLKLGQTAKAVEILQRAVAASPGSFLAQSLLAGALQKSGNIAGAIVHLQAALTLNSNWAEGHAILGTLLAGQGKFQPAAEAFRQVVRLKPQNVEALNNLGTVLKSLSQFDEAIVHLRAAAKLSPAKAEIYNNLGNALLESGNTVEALEHLQQAVALRPDYVQLYQGLGNSLISVGKVDEAIDIFRKALKIDPSHHQIHSSLLMSLHYTDWSNDHPQLLLDEHRQYDRQQTAHLPRPMSYRNDLNPNRRLRIGYFSSDFRRHSVSFFIGPILAQHDPSQVEVFCYAEVATPDEVTARLQRHVPNWRSTYGLSDEKVAEQIQRDQIDILIDLSGHTGGGRMPLFGRKPAPVQATYLGYPDTTGLSAIDYRITDSVADPPDESDRFHTERLIRLTPPFLCFAPPADAPDVLPPPVLTAGHITFGSFNTLAKLTTGTIKLWAEVLNAVPSSRMLIKARGLQHAAVADRIASQFLSCRIEKGRLDFLGHETTTVSHLARYHQVDIALDTFPYNGTTTTCEALWMGVPVVTLAGRIHAARVGASLLTTMDRVQWVAETIDEFVRLATALASDQSKLSEQRTALRSQFEKSPLFDATDFTRRFEFVLRQMWMKLSLRGG